MKAESTLRRELGRIHRLLRNPALSNDERHEMYGARQALAWALGENANAPGLLAAVMLRPLREVSDG